MWLVDQCRPPFFAGPADDGSGSINHNADDDDSKGLFDTATVFVESDRDTLPTGELGLRLFVCLFVLMCVRVCSLHAVGWPLSASSIVAGPGKADGIKAGLVGTAAVSVASSSDAGSKADLVSTVSEHDKLRRSPRKHCNWSAHRNDPGTDVCYIIHPKQTRARNIQSLLRRQV